MQRATPFRLTAYSLLPLLAVIALAAPALAEPSGDDVLTAAEAAYDCKKINGRMQLLILQIRDYPDRDKGSMLARGLQSVTVPLLGGTRTGLDPDGRYQRDLRKLQAFNARLAQLNCPTFDLEYELSVRDVRHTPKPRPAK
jgi:hypothetical protein